MTDIVNLWCRRFVMTDVMNLWCRLFSTLRLVLAVFLFQWKSAWFTQKTKQFPFTWPPMRNRRHAGLVLWPRTAGPRGHLASATGSGAGTRTTPNQTCWRPWKSCWLEIRWKEPRRPQVFRNPPLPTEWPKWIWRKGGGEAKNMGEARVNRAPHIHRLTQRMNTTVLCKNTVVHTVWWRHGGNMKELQVTQDKSINSLCSWGSDYFYVGVSIVTFLGVFSWCWIHFEDSFSLEFLEVCYFL